MRVNQSKGQLAEEAVNPEEVQENLLRKAYVHHDHGGREHGHDWDDWAKAERSTKAQKKKPR